MPPTSSSGLLTDLGTSSPAHPPYYGPDPRPPSTSIVNLQGAGGGHPPLAIAPHYHGQQCQQGVRGIANSNDSVLMQGLVQRRRSVRGHPKARSELGAMEHQNFLFDMERIRPWVFVCASKLALDESLSHQHMGVVYYRGKSSSASTSESYGGGRDHVNDQELLGAPLR
ncbi:hypothetical protein BHE74_00024553 [Ensete ventricosum]|nr:hypothetical protein GW17_00014227 [Ensete ventricosum]RWW67959.1 hypothetical protein BHE74_00024553 [Ensete ventricosum]